MSSSLMVAIIWPPFWGLGIIGQFSRKLRSQGITAPVASPWYPWAIWLLSALIQFCLYAATRYPPKEHVTISPAWGSLGNIIAALLWLLWKRRKDIKRRLAALGNKGLARLEAMLRTLRERTVPQPVLRPVRIPI